MTPLRKMGLFTQVTSIALISFWSSLSDPWAEEQGTGKQDLKTNTDFLHLSWKRTLGKYINTQTLFGAHSQHSTNWFPLRGSPKETTSPPQPAVASGTTTTLWQSFWWGLLFHKLAVCQQDQVFVRILPSRESNGISKLGCTLRAPRTLEHIGVWVPPSQALVSLVKGHPDYKNFQGCPGDCDKPPIWTILLLQASRLLPSPFPLGLTIHPSSLPTTFPRTLNLFPWLPQPYWKPSARVQGLGTGNGRMKLRAASHLLTCALALNSPKHPRMEPRLPGKLEVPLILWQIFNSFLTLQNFPSPAISSWMGHCLR